MLARYSAGDRPAGPALRGHRGADAFRSDWRKGEMPHTVPIAFFTYAGMHIGRDNGLVVDLDYELKAPYTFTGTVKRVIFDLKPGIHDDEHALHTTPASTKWRKGSAHDRNRQRRRALAGAPRDTSAGASIIPDRMRCRRS